MTQPKKYSPADFANLTEAEQREVAARLLKLEQSDWKPFWCPDPDCDGYPHWDLNSAGMARFVPEVLAKEGVDGKPDTGPKGEVLGRLVYLDDEGFWEYDPEDDQCPEPTSKDTKMGRVVLDPKWAHNHARSDQRLPTWNTPWTLFIMSGRGSGKTKTGTEFVTLCARKGLDGAIVGRRGTELVNTHVKTLIEGAHPDFVPEYSSSKDILTWPNGAITYLFSAERPENIRSVNLSYCWFDEAAFMDEVETAWMNAKLATRVRKPNNPIHILVTSTPTATPWVMKMEDDPDIEIRRVSTYANRANLSPDYIAALRKEYEGTRMGRQELHGEVLRDVEGALWNDDLFNHMSVAQAADWHDLVDSMDDRVLAVDPAGSKGKRSDATGIIGVGIQHSDENGEPLQTSRFYVLADATLKGTPTEWARATYATARLIKANRIVVEANFGGEMVMQTLKDFARQFPQEACDENGEEYRVILERAVKSKETRAEPVVGKYEQGRVTHVTCSQVAATDLSMLEKEQVGWVPKSRGGKFPSPNRIDALVWAVRALEKAVKFTGAMATGKSAIAKIKRNPAQGRRPW